MEVAAPIVALAARTRLELALEPQVQRRPLLVHPRPASRLLLVYRPLRLRLPSLFLQMQDAVPLLVGERV